MSARPLVLDGTLRAAAIAAAEARLSKLLDWAETGDIIVATQTARRAAPRAASVH